MRKYTLLIFILMLNLFQHLPLHAQDSQDEMTVKSFEYDMKDLSAATQQRLDNNGTPAALVKVQVLTENEVQFSSSMILGPTDFKFNEYRVYMAAGSKSIKISHPQFPTINVVFAEVSKGTITKLQSQCTYRLVIFVPEKGGDTYEDLQKAARSMHDSISYYTDTEYFMKAIKLYEAAMAHTDCPAAEVTTLQRECNEMKYIRKYTYLYDKMTDKVKSATALYGYESDSVCRYLKLSLAATKKLTKEYPLPNFQRLEAGATKALQKHPCGQTTVTKETEIQNKHITGVVHYNGVLNMAQITIFAAKTEKPQDQDQLSLGSPKQDGSYDVVLPKGYDYLNFYAGGRKNIYLIDQQYKVSDDTQDQTYVLNVTIK